MRSADAIQEFYNGPIANNAAGLKIWYTFDGYDSNSGVVVNQVTGGSALNGTAAGAGGAQGAGPTPIDTDFSFFWPPYQRLTKPRENITAENMDVMMPKQ